MKHWKKRRRAGKKLHGNTHSRPAMTTKQHQKQARKHTRRMDRKKRLPDG